MDTYLVVYGHGAGDPGAGGNGTNERDFNRKILHPYIKKWADKSKHNFVFYDTSGNKDLYQDTAEGWGIYSMTKSQYASITEIHLDAASASATGGHTIIATGLDADGNDLSLSDIINKVVGWWGSVKSTKGINKRNNLLNCNVAKSRGIAYRLMELGFITNESDMDKIKGNLDQYAKGIVEGITGEKLSKEVSSATATQINQFGGISMFTFQEKGSSAIFGVWGNKKFLFANTSELKDFRNIVKDTTGRTCKHYTWEKGHTPFGVVVKMTDE